MDSFATEMRPARCERVRALVVLVGIAAILGLMALPMARRRVFHEDDLGGFHLPLRAFYARCLARGDDPSWFPGLFCGFYLQGEGQVGLSHPLHGLLYRFAPLDLAISIELLMPYPVMLAGTYLLLRRWALPRDAALFGGLVFAFSGFSLLHYFHLNMLAVVMHWPWLLVCLDVIWREPDRRRVHLAFGVVSLLTASELLMGYPQFVWFSLLVEGLYAVSLTPRLRGGWLWRWGGLVGANLLGLLMGAAQALPTYEAFAGSVRDDPSQSFATMNSLHPVNLIQWIDPYLFKARYFDGLAPRSSWPLHEFGLYDTAVVTVLLVWLILRRGRIASMPGLARWAWMLVILGMVLALGGYTPVGRGLVHLPVVGWFRCPTRAIVLIHFAAAPLSALAFADLARLTRRPERLAGRTLWPLALVPIGSLVIAVGVLGWAGAHPRSLLTPLVVPARIALMGPLLMALATGAVILATRGRPRALVFLIALMVLDQTAYGVAKMFWRVPPASIADLVQRESVPPSSDTSLRVLGGTNLLTMRGYSLADGYAGLTPRQRLDYTRPNAQRAARVGWVRDTESPGGWRAVADPVPRAYLVPYAIVSNDPRRDIETLDLKTTVIVEEPVSLVEGEQGRVQYLDDRPGAIALGTATTTRQLLVVSESYHAGWRAAIDGQPTRVLRVNGDFLGCVVPAGTHQVRLEFRPWSLIAGRRLSVFGLGLWLVGMGVILMMPKARLDSNPEAVSSTEVAGTPSGAPAIMGRSVAPGP